MILRTLIGFSIGLALAACDRDNQYVPGGLDLTSDQKPTKNPVIVCCRCGVCQEFSGNVCPAGWKPKAGNWMQN